MCFGFGHTVWNRHPESQHDTQTAEDKFRLTRLGKLVGIGDLGTATKHKIVAYECYPIEFPLYDHAYHIIHSIWIRLGTSSTRHARI